MQKYDRIRQLGKGSFGAAYLVSDKRTGVKYVMKQINIAQLNQKERKEAMQEADILRQLDHPNIVSYIESFVDQGSLCIIMEYADGGDLYEYIKKRQGMLLPENQILDWFVQICMALKHVHDRKILHRDLKTQNIFLCKDNKIKLGDFGIARVLKNTIEYARTSIGTPYYLSPELCMDKPYNNKSDIWSLGCVLYEMCTLRHAFDANSMKGLVMKILSGTYPPISTTRYSAGLGKLVGLMLQKNPDLRPTIHQLIDNPILAASRERVSKVLGEKVIESEFSHTILHSGSGPRIPSRKDSGAARQPNVGVPASGPRYSADMGPGNNANRNAYPYNQPPKQPSAAGGMYGAHNNGAQNKAPVKPPTNPYSRMPSKMNEDLARLDRERQERYKQQQMLVDNQKRVQQQRNAAAAAAAAAQANNEQREKEAYLEARKQAAANKDRYLGQNNNNNYQYGRQSVQQQQQPSNAWNVRNNDPYKRYDPPKLVNPQGQNAKKQSSNYSYEVNSNNSNNVSNNRNPYNRAPGAGAAAAGLADPKRMTMQLQEAEKRRREAEQRRQAMREDIGHRREVSNARGNNNGYHDPLDAPKIYAKEPVSERASDISVADKPIINQQYPGCDNESLCFRIESLRLYLEKEMPGFMGVYKKMRDGEELPDGVDMGFVMLINQLIFCENEFNER